MSKVASPALKEGVQGGPVAVGAEEVHHLLHLGTSCNLAHANRLNLGLRHHHHRAVFLSAQGDEGEALTGHLLRLDARHAADALVRVHDAIAHGELEGRR